MQNAGRGSPSGLEALSTSASSTRPSSDVSTNLSSLHGSKLARVAEQMRAVRDAMDNIQKPKDDVHSVGEIPIDDGPTRMDNKTKPPEVDVISVDDESCDEPQAPSVSIPKMDPAIDTKKVFEVIALLRGSHDQKLIKPKIGPSHQQEGCQQTTSANPHVLPPYVSWLECLPILSIFLHGTSLVFALGMLNNLKLN